MLDSVTRERRHYWGLVRAVRLFWPQPRREVNILKSYEARRGTMVLIREGHWKTELAGMYGTIQKCWGNSEHAAVEVLLEDGHLEFFWLPDLEVVEEDIAV